jgi:hypothetical protein
VKKENPLKEKLMTALGILDLIFWLILSVLYLSSARYGFAAVCIVIVVMQVGILVLQQKEKK